MLKVQWLYFYTMRFVLFTGYTLLFLQMGFADTDDPKSHLVDSITANGCFFDPQRTEILPIDEALALTKILLSERTLREITHPGRGVIYYMITHRECRFQIDLEASGLLWTLAKNGCTFNKNRFDMVRANWVDGVPRHWVLRNFLFESGDIVADTQGFRLTTPHCDQGAGLVDVNLQTIVDLFEHFNCRLGGMNDPEFEQAINWLSDNESSQSLFNAVLPDLINRGLTSDDPETHETILVGIGGC